MATVEPNLVTKLRELSQMLGGWATMLTNPDTFQSELSSDVQSMLDLLVERTHFGRDVYHALGGEDAVELLLDDRFALTDSLRSLLTAIIPVYTALELFRSDGHRLAPFPAEEYASSLDRIDRLVSCLTATHLMIQLHAVSFGSEYSIKRVRSKNAALERKVYENINEAFYDELLSARDAYFLEGSFENLERYVAVAEELATRKHPLATVAESDPSIQRDVAKRARAAELLDSLTVESLVTQLLIDEPSGDER